MSIRKFLASVFSKLVGQPLEESNTLIEEQTENPEESNYFSEEEKALEDLEERINVAKRTLLTRLYTIEQDIAVFARDFPLEYQAFLQRIEALKNSYNYSLEELQKLFTFEIDPESDSSIMNKVIRLEKDVKVFIESTVKFHIISNRLQRLIKKLNILYNVSIFHAKETEKQKACMQLERAIQLERELAEEFKKSDYILSDVQQKERIVELLSYVDYEIFKCSIRTSKQSLQERIQKLVLIEEFEQFDYVTTFIAYLKDELSDLLELLPFISDEEQHTLLKSESEKLLIELTYSKNFAQTLLEVRFWNDYLNFESTLLEMLKVEKIVPEEKITVKVIDRMDIKTDEKEVLVSPKSNANFALMHIYGETHDKRVLLMTKLLQQLSNDITYREIYFLLLLFDVLEVVRNTQNDLSEHMEKYIVKYPCNQKDMLKKKQLVLESPQKDYVVLFSSEDEEATSTLRSLRIDFKVESGNIFINSFYFNGLEHVLCNLQTNTNKIRIASI